METPIIFRKKNQTLEQAIMQAERRDAVLAFLSKGQAPAKQIATALGGVNPGTMSNCLKELHQDMMIRKVNNVDSMGYVVQGIAWALGYGDEELNLWVPKGVKNTVEHARVIKVKAVQRGIQRDPLVAALFGSRVVA